MKKKAPKQLTPDDIIALRPCWSDAHVYRAFGDRNQVGIDEIVNAIGHRLSRSNALWVLVALLPTRKERVKLACHWLRKAWHLLKDERSRRVVAVSERSPAYRQDLAMAAEWVWFHLMIGEPVSMRCASRAAALVGQGTAHATWNVIDLVSSAIAYDGDPNGVGKWEEIKSQTECEQIQDLLDLHRELGNL